jgi:23S rRNA (guanine745-N1)-methyltransferase
MSDDGTRRPGGFPAAGLPFLRCPICGAGLSAAAAVALSCPSRHSFDIARQGYVNLLAGDARPGTADTAAMVEARHDFLAAGHFAGLRDFVCYNAQRALAQISGDDGCILEVGAGTGYYLAAVLDCSPARVGLALDISKFAARRATRAHERIAAIVCDAWDTLPVVDACAALVLNVFAPRNPPEFRRVLRPEGKLLVVTPTPRHLGELVDGLGLLHVDERKRDRLETAFAADFVLVEQTEYEEHLRLLPHEAVALAAMGPSAHHLRAEELAERLAALGEVVTATVAVTAGVYAPRALEYTASAAPGPPS